MRVFVEKRAERSVARWVPQLVERGHEVLGHEATALAGLTDLKHFDASFAETNRLRTEGTDALLAAAREAGRGAKRCDTVSRHTAIARPAATLRV